MFKSLCGVAFSILIAGCQVTTVSSGPLEYDSVSDSSPRVSRPMTVSQRALPPRGFVEFCIRHAADCQEANATSGPVQLTAERWAQLVEVNRTVNRSFRFAEDSTTNGQSEYWDYPKDAGDCEDFALEKQKQLIAKGWPKGSLLITTANVPRIGGHAVLVVVTDNGDYVLDILNSSVRSWDSVGYRWQKRQSPLNPQVWQKISV